MICIEQETDREVLRQVALLLAQRTRAVFGDASEKRPRSTPPRPGEASRRSHGDAAADLAGC